MKRSIFEILSRGTKTISPGCRVRSFSRSLVRLMVFRFSSLTSAMSELILRNTTTCDDFTLFHPAREHDCLQGSDSFAHFDLAGLCDFSGNYEIGLLELFQNYSRNRIL